MITAPQSQLVWSLDVGSMGTELGARGPHCITDNVLYHASDGFPIVQDSCTCVLTFQWALISRNSNSNIYGILSQDCIYEFSLFFGG